MSDSRYDYDENSETWPYFALTGVLVALVPATIAFVSGQLGRAQAKKAAFQPVDWYKAYNEPAVNRYRAKQKHRVFLTLRFALIVIGWILVVFLALKIQGIEVKVGANSFDPWQILGIEESASMREIRAVHRKLSQLYHPDKVDKTGMSQEQIDEVEAKYVLISKAYKALTDDSVRDNFLKYGNPDGPGEITHGIAIPKFLVDGPTSPVFVAVYILLIAVILPLCVNQWWSGVKSHTRRGIYTETASYFMETMLNYDPANVLQIKGILADVAHAKEFADISKKLTPESVLELLMAHINRESVKDEALKMAVVAETPRLLLGYLDIAAAFRKSDVCIAIVDAHKCIVQALNIEDSTEAFRYRQILQLPSVTLEKLDKSQPMYTLGKLLKKPTASPDQFLHPADTAKVLDYAAQIPLIAPLECSFKVTGETFVPPQSHVHVDLRFAVKSAAQKGVPAPEKLAPEVVDTQLHEPITMEHLRDPFKVVEDQPAISLPYTSSFFPDEEYVAQHSGWVALLVVQKDTRLADAPAFITRADMANLSLDQAAWEQSKAQVSVFKFPMTAPSPAEAGEYQFRLVLKSLVYFGSDLEIPLVMKVEDKPEQVSEDAYGIEDPDEDSLAGAMAQLRGEKVKRVEYSSDEESSSDESDDESEEESDWTDMDTDTDDEDEKK